MSNFMSSRLLRGGGGGGSCLGGGGWPGPRGTLRHVVLFFALFLGHGEGEQVGDGGLLDVGDVDRLVHLAQL